MNTSTANQTTASSLQIETVVVTPFQQNCRILWETGARECVVIDPGGDAESIMAQIERRQLTVQAIWLTHAHPDHCGGVAAIIEACPCALFAHPIEQLMRARVPEINAMFGLADYGMRACPEPTQPISGGEVLSLGSLRFEVRFTPGHSPGHVVFYCASAGTVIAGDTLFFESIGRTDLPHGNAEQLFDSIARQLMTLPDDTKILPGHGPDTTIGHERTHNPFLQGAYHG